MWIFITCKLYLKNYKGLSLNKVCAIVYLTIPLLDIRFFPFFHNHKL